MGQVINQIKVKCDYDNSRDKNFVFTVITDGTEVDMQSTVNKLLQQKVAEGEMESQNLRSITIDSDDERGFFSSFAGDVESFVKNF